MISKHATAKVFTLNTKTFMQINHILKIIKFVEHNGTIPHPSSHINKGDIYLEKKVKFFSYELVRVWSLFASITSVIYLN